MRLRALAPLRGSPSDLGPTQARFGLGLALSLGSPEVDPTSAQPLTRTLKGEPDTTTRVNFRLGVQGQAFVLAYPYPSERGALGFTLAPFYGVNP